MPQYLSGFGNEFATEALPGALPDGQNSPQRAPHGLYAEQLNGTSFLMPRGRNLRSWLYRSQPSVVQSAYQPFEAKHSIESFPLEGAKPNPTQFRWDPIPYPSKPVDFIEGITTLCGNGSLSAQQGCGVHVYTLTKPMGSRFFYNADGDFLFVPQEGEVELRTEFGDLELEIGDIAVLPRGIKAQLNPKGAKARGFICENYGLPFRLPDLGPIGANGLANPRDFLTPVAAFEEKTGDFELVAKFHGALWVSRLDHSPLDVVAWHGNYVPYKYDLRRFNTMNSVSYDHPDPSIYTVLTSPSEIPGTSNIDFVIFPPRWMVAENTFRPPYYHRNLMSEFMGLLWGVYDAKTTGGFVPGGSSLHNCMSPHGPDAGTFEKASEADLKPERLPDTMAFMFESRYPFVPTSFAMKTPQLQKDYVDCWRDLKKLGPAKS